MHYQTMPSWSPERCRIAFSSHTSDGDDDIFIMNADGTSIRRLTDDPARDMFPEWSPDSQKLYFISNRSAHVEIWEINLDSSGSRQISNLYRAGIAMDQSLRISPDGGSLVFYRTGQDPNYMTDLFRIGVDGSGLTNLTRTNGKEEWVDW